MLYIPPFDIITPVVVQAQIHPYLEPLIGFLMGIVYTIGCMEASRFIWGRPYR